MRSIHILISKLDKICATTPAQINKKSALKELLLALEKANDMLPQHLLELKQYAYSAGETTFSFLSFFSCSPSFDEEIQKIFRHALSTHVWQIYLDKLIQQAETLTSTNPSDPLVAINAMIENRKYDAALDALKHFYACVDIQQQQPLYAATALIEILSRHVELQIKISAKQQQYHGNVTTSILDESQSINAMTLDGISQLVQKNKETMSFIYVIDLERNILFVPDATFSRHKNILGGKAVYYAGEVYLKISNNEIIVTEINNKSAFYRPGNEMLKPLLHWFKQHGYNTEKTMLNNITATNYCHLKCIL